MIKLENQPNQFSYSVRTLCRMSFCLIAASGLCMLLSARELKAADKPNVVWLISEDNSVHYLQLFDRHGTATPHIAALASHGLTYRHAFSNAPVCSVARTTLMTGCYAPRIGTQFHRRSVSVPMPDGVEMFPALLHQANYYTTNNQKKDYNADESANTWNESSKTATWRNRTAGQPFFHMQSFTTTHESSLHFPLTDLKNKPTETDPASVFVPPYHPDTELFRYTIARYHDNIRTVDAQIGAVVDQLRADKLLDDTFIFYFGDHGGVLPRGKGYAYESGLHVPLVVYVPKNFAHLVPYQMGGQVDGFVEFADFGSTVLSLAGVKIPESTDGQAFLGSGVTADEVDSRDEALGYADRFDEKYDLVRTLRKGKFEYVRSYQPFNFDGLQNNYRYRMLAYEQWREMYEAGQLNAVQKQFFETRPAEMLFDIEADPHEVNDLSANPEFAEVLNTMRTGLQQRLKDLPDLSFLPESVLVEEAFSNPTQFGQQHQDRIAKLIQIADLSLLPFKEARDDLSRALQSTDPMQRYWAVIACTCFGNEAREFFGTALHLAQSDENLLVRTRAAEFLAIADGFDPEQVLLKCLESTVSGVECNLILNTLVLLRDGPTRCQFDLKRLNNLDAVRRSDEAQRRLLYLNLPDGLPRERRR